AGKTQKTKTNDAPSHQSPSKVDLTETQKASEVSEKTKDQKTEPASTDWWIMVFTAVLAGAAIIQLIVYAWQAHYSRAKPSMLLKEARILRLTKSRSWLRVKDHG